MQKWPKIAHKSPELKKHPTKMEENGNKSKTKQNRELQRMTTIFCDWVLQKTQYIVYFFKSFFILV